MRAEKIRKMIYAAIFASLVCVVTMVVSVPSPVGGYCNLGDSIILLSAFMLGPVYGAAASGIGSMLADLILGFAAYAPGTFVIKATAACIAAFLFRVLTRNERFGFFKTVIPGLCGELFMIAGYFVYGALILKYRWGAAAEIPGNAIQALSGITVAAILLPLLKKTRIFKF